MGVAHPIQTQGHPGRADGIYGTGSTNTGPTSQKMDVFMNNVVFSIFLPFLDLLDLKNGSGSKFYAGYTGYEVWKP